MRRKATGAFSRGRWVAALLLFFCARLEAQIVRGSVTESVSGLPVPGVVIYLVPASDSGRSTSGAIRAVLSGGNGAFAITATGPGRYVIVAKRIGVRAFTSAAFDLSDGEARRVDVTVERTTNYVLPVVKVSAATPCDTRRQDAPRIAALFSEIQTALTATDISLRDSLFAGEVTLYSRSIVPETRLVEREIRTTHAGVMGRPFHAADADSLSRYGWWRELPGDSVQFFGVDGDVLRSTPFLRDHCFRIARESRAHPDAVGLAFEPVRRRAITDVTGTIWMDSRTFALQSIEFGYTRLPRGRNVSGVGGDVHFAELPNGAWLLSHWSIRIPQTSYLLLPAPPPKPPVRLDREGVYRLSEGGGFIRAEGLTDSVAENVVRGTVLDSAGAPLVPARVGVVGAPALRTTADSAGRFALRGLLAGNYRLFAASPGYDALGVQATVDDVAVGGGNPRSLDLHAMDTEATYRRLCGTARKPVDHGVVHLTLRDDTDGSPVAQTAVRMLWEVVYFVAAREPDVKHVRLDALTDTAGAVNLCDLPPGTRLALHLAAEPDSVPPVAIFRLRPGELRAETVRVVRERN